MVPFSFLFFCPPGSDLPRWLGRSRSTSGLETSHPGAGLAARSARSRIFFFFSSLDRNLAENSPCGRLENELTQISVGSREEGSANQEAPLPRLPRIGCGENQLSNNRSAGSFDLPGMQTASPDSRPDGGQKADSPKAAGPLLASPLPSSHTASCGPALTPKRGRCRYEEEF